MARINKINLFLRNNKVFKDIGFLSLGTLISKGVNFIKDIFLASLLGPKYYGLWIQFLMLVNYSTNIPFGFQHLLGREIPYLESNKNYNEIKNLQGVAIYVTIIVFLICVIIYFAFNGFNIFPSLLTNVLLVVTVLLFTINSILSITIRSYQLFEKFTLSSIIYSISLFILTYILSKIFSIDGSAFSFIITLLLLNIYWLKLIPIPVELSIKKLKFNSNYFIESSALFVSGLIGMLMFSVDRLIMMYFYDDKIIGYYGLAFVLNQSIFLIITPINQSIVPKMNYRFGKNNNILDIVNFLKIFANGLTAIVSVIAGFLYLSTDFIIDNFISDYLESKEIIKIILIGSIFMTISNGTSSFLIGIKKQHILLKNQTITLVFEITLLVIVGINNFSVKYIGMSFVVSMIIYSILNLISCYKIYDLSYKIILKKIWTIISAPIILFIITYYINMLNILNYSYINYIIKIFVFISSLYIIYNLYKQYFMNIMTSFLRINE